MGNARNPRGTKQLDVILSEFEQVHGFDSARCISKGHDGPFAFDYLEIVVEPVVCLSGDVPVLRSSLTLSSLHRRRPRSLLHHS